MHCRIDRKTREALARIVRSNLESDIAAAAREGVRRCSPEGWCRELVHVQAELCSLVGAIAGPEEEKALRVLLQGDDYAEYTHGEHLLQRAQDPRLNERIQAIRAAEAGVNGPVATGAH